MKTCEEITSDIERGSYEQLSVREKLGVKMHLVLCKPCKSYEKDSKFIDILLKRQFSDLRKYKFSDEEKSAMIIKMRD